MADENFIRLCRSEKNFNFPQMIFLAGPTGGKLFDFPKLFSKDSSTPSFVRFLSGFRQNNKKKSRKSFFSFSLNLFVIIRQSIFFLLGLKHPVTAD